MSVFSMIPGSGGSNIDLSDITAGPEHILAGYESIDSSGELISGEIFPMNSDPVYVTSVSNIPGAEAVCFDIPSTGYYERYGFGLWADYADVASAIGLDASKLKTGVTVLGITGT